LEEIMAGLGNQNDRFAPPADQQVSVMGPGGFQLGKVMPAPMMPSLLGNTPASILKPHQMAQGAPRGTQEIPVIGMTPRQGGLRMAGRPQQPQMIPQLGMQQQPQQHRLPAPAPAPVASPPQQIALGANEQMHKIEVRGIAPDGIEYVAKYDAIFPRGTRLLGATEVAPG
jgi:hypothetical protein